jgi:hypothetical protein
LSDSISPPKSLWSWPAFSRSPVHDEDLNVRRNKNKNHPWPGWSPRWSSPTKEVAGVDELRFTVGQRLGRQWSSFCKQSCESRQSLHARPPCRSPPLDDAKKVASACSQCYFFRPTATGGGHFKQSRFGPRFAPKIHFGKAGIGLGYFGKYLTRGRQTPKRLARTLDTIVYAKFISR